MNPTHNFIPPYSPCTNPPCHDLERELCVSSLRSSTTFARPDRCPLSFLPHPSYAALLMIRNLLVPFLIPSLRPFSPRTSLNDPDPTLVLTLILFFLLSQTYPLSTFRPIASYHWHHITGEVFSSILCFDYHRMTSSPVLRSPPCVALPSPPRSSPEASTLASLTAWLIN